MCDRRVCCYYTLYGHALELEYIATVKRSVTDGERHGEAPEPHQSRNHMPVCVSSFQRLHKIFI